MAHCWKANGGSTTTNTDGNRTTTIMQVNKPAGFSIFGYQGDGTGGSSGNTFTIGLGLEKIPDWVVFKCRPTNSNNGNWHTFHRLGNGFDKYDYLNDATAPASNSGNWGVIAADSSILTMSIGSGVANTTWNESGKDFIVYCWTEVEGYSKFDTFVGNGNADGPFVHLGFRPSLIVIDGLTTGVAPIVFDNKRSIDNVVQEYIYWSYDNAEATFDALDICSSGFKIKSSAAGLNPSATMMYRAWAEQPFKYSNAR